MVQANKDSYLLHEEAGKGYEVFNQTAAARSAVVFGAVVDNTAHVFFFCTPMAIREIAKTQPR